MPLFSGFPKNYKTRPLLFIDLEMTGLDPKQHEIIEVAGLLVDPQDYSITNSYYAKVLPTHIHTADPQSLQISGYNPTDWRDAISLRQFLIEISAFAPNCFLAGFSVQNEWNFLISALESEQLPYFFDNYILEVWTLAYTKYHHHPDITNIGLSSLCKLLDIPIQRHRPDSDIRATYEIFRKLSTS
jgi:DNA polymerase-3 subunit epsilon